MRSSLRTLPLLLLLSIANPAAATEQAGVSAAVRGRVSLTRATSSAVPVQSGDSIFVQDAIRSGPSSGMQILLLDQTAFTIGPDSEMTVDEFVYDPNRSVGKVSANITQGVFRFVSGRVAAGNPDDMKVKISSGTLGVRGTMVAGRVDAATQETLVVLLGEGNANDTGSKPGAIQVCNAGECVDVRRAGYGTQFDGPNQPPVAPFLVPAAQLEALTRQVSDPQGVLDGKAETRGATPDVAAGGDEGDTRSPTDVSGRSSVSGLSDSRDARAVLATIGVVNFASDLPEQSSNRGIALPEEMPELPAGPTAVPAPENTPTLYGREQLNAAVLGGQQAAYVGRGLRLSDGGSYDFSMTLDVGRRNVDVDLGNIQAPSLGISEQQLSWGIGFRGDNAPVALNQQGQLSGSAPSCSPSCDAFLAGLVVNRNGRLADTVLQSLKIIPNATEGGGTVTPVKTLPADYPVRRP